MVHRYNAQLRDSNWGSVGSSRRPVPLMSSMHVDTWGRQLYGPSLKWMLMSSNKTAQEETLYLIHILDTVYMTLISNTCSLLQKPKWWHLLKFNLWCVVDTRWGFLEGGYTGSQPHPLIFWEGRGLKLPNDSRFDQPQSPGLRFLV